jgi:hypothetical protein
MNRGRVGEERGSKETDGCPLTVTLDTPHQHILIFNYLVKSVPRDINTLQVPSPTLG